MVNIKELKFQYVTNKAGKKTAVLLPIEEFHKLLEDIADLAIVAERREESAVSHDKLIAELKQDGLI